MRKILSGGDTPVTAFYGPAEEKEKIRQDPVATGSAVPKKAFGALK